MKQMIKTREDFAAALAQGCKITHTMRDGWLLVNANQPTKRVSVKVVRTSYFTRAMLEQKETVNGN